MLEKIIEKFPLNVMRRRDQAGRVYIRAYKNVYEKLPDGSGRSKVGQCIQMGRLQEDGCIKLGKSFLKSYPEFEGQEVYYLDNQLLTREEYLTARGVMMICEEYEDAYPPESQIDSVRFFGASYALDQLARKQNLPELLRMTFGKRLGNDLYALAMYAAIDTGASQHFQTWLSKNWVPNARPLSSQRISEIYASVDSDSIDRFWANKIQHRLSGSDQDIICCAVDSTSISTYSKTIVTAAYGHNKQNEDLKQTNLVMAMDSNSRDVIFTKFVDGSIPDVRSFQPFFAEMVRRHFPMERFCLVMDRGYDSIKIIEQLLQANTKFTLAMRSTPWLKDEIVRCHEEIELPQHWSVKHEMYGMKSRYVVIKYDIGNGVTQEKRVNVMTYKNSERATAEISNLMQNLGEFMVAKNAGDQVDESLWRTVRPFITNDHEDEKGWSFNQEAIKKYKHLAGGFTLLTNMYDQPWPTLDLYRQRNVIEMGFDWLKNEVKGSRLFVSEKSFNGMLFTRILAQMLRLALYNAVVKADLPRQGSEGGLPHLLKVLGVLKVKYENGTWRVDQIPLRYREFFEKLEIPLPA